jgi:hypothetical protein
MVMAAIRRALVIAAGVSLLLAPAGFANKPKKPVKPSGGERTVTATAHGAGNGAIVSATASCPKGMRAVAGGFNAPSSVEVLGLVFESVRTASRSWRASAQLLDIGATSGLTLEATAYCKRKFFAGKTRRVTAATDGEPHVGPLVGASCRRSQIAVSGGFTMPAPLFGQAVTALVLDSRRDGAQAWNTWLATGAGGTGSAATEVYCARRQRELSEAVATSAASFTFFESLSATARCAGGNEPTSGGFSQPQSDTNSFLFVYESRRVGGGWKVSGMHSGAEPAVTLNALAYC